MLRAPVHPRCGQGYSDKCGRAKKRPWKNEIHGREVCWSCVCYRNGLAKEWEIWRMAKLYFYYSTMNAGKSTALLQAAHNYAERGMSALLFTAKLDDRAGGRIASRIGISADAKQFDTDTDFWSQLAHVKTDCVLLDEAQF